MNCVACRGSIPVFRFPRAVRADGCNCSYSYRCVHITSLGISTLLFIYLAIMSCIYLVQIRIPPTPPKFFCLSDNEDYKYRSLTFVPTANPIDLGGSCLGSECKAPEAEALCCAAAGAASAVGSGLFLRAACVSKGRGAARSRAPHPLFQHCCNSASLFKMQSPNRRCSVRNAAVL